jgi:MFS transporter, OFA family, oxalate/formate antiporter
LFLWTVFLLSATAGLMLIAHIAVIAQTQAGWKAGFVLVVIISLFNALGRVGMGFLSDRLGSKASLLFVLLLQAVNMFVFSFYHSVPLLIAGTAIAGLSYGSLFALFPSATTGYFGIKNLGVNYGLVFTGWGIAGVIGPLLGGLVVDHTGTYTISYLVSAVLLLVGVVMVFFMNSKQVETPKQAG